MKQLFIALLFSVIAAASQAQDTRVILEIENVDVKKGGETAVAIFGKNNFLKMGKQIRAESQPVDGTTMSFVFSDLPPGEYAFVAFQDIDRSKSLRKNFIGYPTEPFGISNNPRMIFGPPSFDEAKLKLQAGQTITVRIKLN